MLPYAPLRVSFQGEPGAFSEMATREYFADQELETVPCPTFQDAAELVEQGAVQYGCLPIENSTYGTVIRTYELLLETGLHIIGELYYRVQQCLIAPHGMVLEDVQVARSHYQALGQCRQWLRQHGIEAVEWSDTAGAVKSLLEPAPGVAAIASRLAAEIYGMNVLEPNINQAGLNFTRFVILSPTAADIKKRVINKQQPKVIKTSLVVESPRPLFQILGAFALREIEVVKVEAHPKPETPFKPRWFLDFLGDKDDKNCQNALNQLREHGNLIVLGSYFDHYGLVKSHWK
ncbi:MAG TPA: prephenate dehydratase domain-containing protein [Anaerolineales bacterium]|nr:prephenate dehydratase domain-containing protein [Anaerolineales bacterium]